MNTNFVSNLGSSDIQWCFSQVKGTLDDDVTEGKFEADGLVDFGANFPFHLSADIISCVEFNQDGDLLATGDKGGRVVIFQRDPAVRALPNFKLCVNI